MATPGAGDPIEEAGTDLDPFEIWRQRVNIEHAREKRGIREMLLNHFDDALGSAVLGQIIMDERDPHRSPLRLGHEPISRV